jgi:hypothetical protein
MAKQYRVGGSVRFNNAAMCAMLRMGLGFRSFAILVVAGRKTGRQLRTPIVVFRQGECRYVVAPYGIVNWVRNLRAAEGLAELIRGRRTEPIIATELPPEQAAPILGDGLRAGPPGVPRFIVRTGTSPIGTPSSTRPRWTRSASSSNRPRAQPDVDS